ncbi:MAG: hypothetical protein AAGJ52_01795 [Pseudomonadota bacterium]
MNRFVILVGLLLASGFSEAQVPEDPVYVRTNPSWTVAGEDIELVVITGIPACGNALASSSISLQQGIHEIRYDVIPDDTGDCDHPFSLRFSLPLAPLDAGLYYVRVFGRYDQNDIEPEVAGFWIRQPFLPQVYRLEPLLPSVEQPLTLSVLVSGNGCYDGLFSNSVDVVGRKIFLSYEAGPRTGVIICGVPPSLGFQTTVVPTQGGEHEVVILGNYDGVDLDPISFTFGVAGRPAPVPLGRGTFLLLSVFLLLIGVAMLGRRT